MSNLIILKIENVIAVFLLLSYSYLFKNKQLQKQIRILGDIITEIPWKHPDDKVMFTYPRTRIWPTCPGKLMFYL